MRRKIELGANAKIVAFIAAWLASFSVSLAEAADKKQVFQKWVKASEAVHLAEICSKKVGGFKDEVAFFSQAEAKHRKVYQKAYGAKPDPRFGEMLARSRPLYTGGLGRVYWKDYCKKELSYLKWNVR